MSEIGVSKHELDTPLLWVDLDIMEQNIARLARRFQEAAVAWRPHSKGIKIPAIIHKAIARGAIGVTCAKLSEAEVMVMAGIQDILIANQIVGPVKIRRLIELCRQADVKVAVDNVQNLREIGAAAVNGGVRAAVLVEVDLGMKRSGVTPGAAAVHLSQIACETPGIAYMGLMGWEGQASIITDPEQKEAAVKTAVGFLTDTMQQCRAAGLSVSIVSAGGSATSDITSYMPGVTEIQAGGAIFSDILYRHRGVTNEPSLFVRSTVTSRPADDRIIFDAGFKALPGWTTSPQLRGLDNVKSIRMSAEHGTVTLEKPNTTVQVGDVFDFVVSYGDYTVFLHDHLYGIRDGVVEVAWPIEGRGKLR